VAPLALLIVALSAAVLLGAEKAPKPDPNIQLPDYRGWSHVKSMAIYDEKHPLFASFGGLHHVYANEKAYPSTNQLKEYPDGSTLVFVLYELAEKDGAYSAGAKKLTAVMEKAGKYKDTGGWGFQAWGADGKPLVYDGGASCFACHNQGAATTDFVFSRPEP
jgi:hypothetical protein